MDYNNTIFGGLLKQNFVSHSMPANASIHPEIELLKDKAGRLALTMFDPDRKDIDFGQGRTFGSVFTQDIFGAGFTKGLSIIFAYLICLQENYPRGTKQSEAMRAFAAKVQEISQSIFKRLESGDYNLSDVRKLAEQLDNDGGYYQRTLLSVESTQKVIPEGTLKCSLEMDPYAGHLVAKVSPDLSQQLLDAYRSEIEAYLTEEGKKNLKLPYNKGCVVIAYKDELASIPKEKIESILNSGKQVDLSFKEPYIVPVRGDNRYSLIASILINSPVMTDIRKEMQLGPLYSEGRPLRYTFGAVHTPHLTEDNETLVTRMRRCIALIDWRQFIDAQ